jgi:hypothetical protein
MEATLSTRVIDDYVASLPESQRRTHVRSTVQRLRQLSTDAEPLSHFLSSFAESVADLYAANSVAIWFQSTSRTSNVVRKVDVGWNNMALDVSTDQAHKSLIGYAIESGKAMAVQPFSAPAKNVGVSNPTDSFLLLTPAKFDQQSVAVLEIVLGPKPLRRPHEVLMASYLDWLGWLSQLMLDGMQRCFAEPHEQHLLAIASLQETTVAVGAIQNQIRHRIEQTVQAFAGQNFGSLSANQAVTKQVHTLLDSKGLRVKCPECGTPAILRCQNAGNSKNGAFMFDHYLDTGRTFHGGQTTFPVLEVVSKPPRRKVK